MQNMICINQTFLYNTGAPPFLNIGVILCVNNIHASFSMQCSMHTASFSMQCSMLQDKPSFGLKRVGD